MEATLNRFTELMESAKKVCKHYDSTCFCAGGSAILKELKTRKFITTAQEKEMQTALTEAWAEEVDN